jgi:hypothetical protein
VKRGRFSEKFDRTAEIIGLNGPFGKGPFLFN